MFAYPLRNYKDAGAKGGLPVTAVKLTDLVQHLQVGVAYNFNNCISQDQ